MKPHKISTHSAHSDNCYIFSFFLSVVWLSWNFVRFHEILFQTDSVSAFYLEKQKSFIPKKKFLSRCQYQNKKALFTDSIFTDGFAGCYSIFVCNDACITKVIATSFLCKCVPFFKLEKKIMWLTLDWNGFVSKRFPCLSKSLYSVLTTDT